LWERLPSRDSTYFILLWERLPSRDSTFLILLWERLPSRDSTYFILLWERLPSRDSTAMIVPAITLFRHSGESRNPASIVANSLKSGYRPTAGPLSGRHRYRRLNRGWKPLPPEKR
jgi:hypothetical protein